MATNAAASPFAQVLQPAAEPWIALVQSGLLVGRYSGDTRAGARAATHLAVADGRNIEVYEVDPQVSPPAPPIGTEVVPTLWGWKHVS